MHILKNDFLRLEINEQGLLKGLYHKDESDNLVDTLGSISYTLFSDDITVGEKPAMSPYSSREAFYDEVRNEHDKITAYNYELGVRLTYELSSFGFRLELVVDSTELSEFGINLAFNYMGKLHGGSWKRQFLLSNPYRSEDNQHQYFYLSRVEGINIILIPETEAAGWKIDYSPYVGGHYFDNLKYFTNFDRVFQAPKNENKLVLHVVPVEDLLAGQKVFTEIKKVPHVLLRQSGGLVGSRIPFKILGACDCLEISDKKGKRILERGDVLEVQASGITKITPFHKGKKGCEATVYGYESFQELYRKSMETVNDADISKTDRNLCEHQCWASATLRYLINQELSESVQAYLEGLLNTVMTENEEEAVERVSIFPRAHDGYPPYYTYKSDRIQEAFFGAGILIDAYRHFKNRKYLEYAVATLKSLIEHNLEESGRIIRLHRDGLVEDYTTVTAPMLQLVDIVLVLEQENDPRAEYFRNACRKIAAFLYERGYSFPTEGGDTHLVQEQMEEGSISCTALSLLYYLRHIEFRKDYLNFAKEILKVHDAWVMKVPLANLYFSTLRWWETNWEGDADGPALCCGHAWTIWRAEADFLFALLALDSERLLASYNGFMSNYAKINKLGQSYSIYQIDYITGGGLTMDKKDVEFRIKTGFPKQTDSGLSRYVFTRAYDTWAHVTAIIRDEDLLVLNGRLEGENLVSDAILFDTLYVDGYVGKLRVKAKDLQIVSKQKYVTEQEEDNLVIFFY